MNTEYRVQTARALSRNQPIIENSYTVTWRRTLSWLCGPVGEKIKNKQTKLFLAHSSPQCCVSSLAGFIYAQLSYGPATEFQSGWSLDFKGALDFFFLFRPLFCRFAAVLEIVVLLHDPLLAKLQLSGRWPHKEYFGIMFRVDSMTARCTGPR